MSIKLTTQPSVLPETERIRNQTHEEWLAEYDDISPISKSISTTVIEPSSKTTPHQQSPFLESVNKAGIVSVKSLGDKLLITTDRHITTDLDNRIKQALPRLVKITKTDTGEPLYEYVEYRTFFSEIGPHLALVFKEIHTGDIAERFFNIVLKNRKGKCFKTRINGEFRIKGSINRPIKGSFIKFWKDTMNDIPDNRVSHIHRYVNSKLSGVVISCPDPEPHHDGTKLHSWKYEGRLYKIT